MMKIDNSPLVSVIVITYNSSATVLETLESIENQSYPNIELIVSDDCSTDNTREIVRNWLQKNTGRFHNQRLVETPCNKGIPANCNQGIYVSNGEWIKIIAADDVLFSDAIESYLNYVSEFPKCKWIYGNMKVYNDFITESHIHSSDWAKDLNLKEFELIPLEMKIRRLAHENVFPAPSVFFKRKIFDAVNGFDERYPLCEDYPFIMRLIEAGFFPYFIEKPLVGYRRNTTSVTSTSRGLLFNYDYQKCLFHIKKEYCFKYLHTRDRTYYRLVFGIHTLFSILNIVEANRVNKVIYTTSLRCISVISKFFTLFC